MAPSPGRRLDINHPNYLSLVLWTPALFYCHQRKKRIKSSERLWKITNPTKLINNSARGETMPRRAVSPASGAHSVSPPVPTFLCGGTIATNPEWFALRDRFISSDELPTTKPRKPTQNQEPLPGAVHVTKPPHPSGPHLYFFFRFISNPI